MIRHIESGGNTQQIDKSVATSWEASGERDRWGTRPEEVVRRNRAGVRGGEGGETGQVRGKGRRGEQTNIREFT